MLIFSWIGLVVMMACYLVLASRLKRGKTGNRYWIVLKTWQWLMYLLSLAALTLTVISQASNSWTKWFLLSNVSAWVAFGLWSQFRLGRYGSKHSQQLQNQLELEKNKWKNVVDELGLE